MKILSNFKDYYDIGLSYGIDENILYIRKKEFIDKSNNDIKNIMSYIPNRIPYGGYISRTCSTMDIQFNSYDVISFCGKLFPVINMSYVEDESIEKNCYNINHMDRFIKKHNFKFYKDTWIQREKNYHWGKNKTTYRCMRENFEKYYNSFLDINESMLFKFHHELDCPIFIVGNVHVPDDCTVNNKRGITKNPCLKDFNFAKEMDPYTAFQELSMFISGVLGGQTPKMIEIDDKTRLEKHGFDKKTSFRNM